MNSARMRAVKLSAVWPLGTAQLLVVADARRLPECIWRPIGLTDRVNHDAMPAQADDPTAKEQITAIGATCSACLAQPRTARRPESPIIRGKTGHCRQHHHDRAIPCLPPPMSAIQELLGPRHKWTQGTMIGKVRRNFLSFCAFPAGRQPGYRLSICDRQTATPRFEDPQAEHGYQREVVSLADSRAAVSRASNCRQCVNPVSVTRAVALSAGSSETPYRVRYGRCAG